jgi:hypothetical protein
MQVQPVVDLHGVRALASKVAADLAVAGAEAIVLVGSHARGDASPTSDLDLAVVGEGPHHVLELRQGVLVSCGWASADEQRRRLYDPEYLCTHVTGWRSGIILHDPQHIAADIQAESARWSWSLVDEPVGAAVAARVTGLAEEVQKLASALAQGLRTAAAVQRSVIALHLPLALALHRRILYPSQNEAWDLVGQAGTDEWERTQRAALGETTSSLEETCRAALELYRLAVEETNELLDEDQRAIVELALRQAGYPTR